MITAYISQCIVNGGCHVIDMLTLTFGPSSRLAWDRCFEYVAEMAAGDMMYGVCTMVP